MSSYSKFSLAWSVTLSGLRRKWGNWRWSPACDPQASPFQKAPTFPGLERLKESLVFTIRTYPRLCAGLFFAIITFAVYLPVLPGNLLMDDLKLIEWDNPIVSGKLSALSIWFQSDFPLSTIAFWLERLAWAKNPGWYHFTNIVLHATSAFLLWRLLLRLRIPGALLAALLFAVHPVCVTSVGRIAELKNTLSLPFFLISIWAFIGYEDSSLYRSDSLRSNRSSVPALYYTISFVFFVLALFSKTSTIMLPMALLAAGLWRRGRLNFRDFLHTAPHFFLSLSFGLMSAWFQKYQALAGQTLPSQSFVEKLIIAARAFWFYISKALVPTNLNLVYPRWTSDIHAFTSYIPLVLILFVAVVCLGFRTAWTRPLWLALACFGMLLFPALGFFDAQYLTMWQVSDHLQYLPLIVPLALAAGLVASVRNKIVFIILAIVLISGFSLLTHQRASVFSTEQSLLRDTLAKNPAAWAAHNDLGCLLAREENYGQAALHFTASLATNPQNADAHVNLGQLLSMQGKNDEAESHFTSALKIKPSHPDAHLRYAAMLARRGRERQALLHYRSSLAANPAVQTRMDYSALLYRTGDNQKAATQLFQALKIQPDHPEALNNLAWILSTCPDQTVRDGKKAVELAGKACELTGFQKAGMIGTLAAANAEAGNFPQAIANAEKAIEVAGISGNLQFADMNRQLLRLYRAGRAWHEKAGNPAR